MRDQPALPNEGVNPGISAAATQQSVKGGWLEEWAPHRICPDHTGLYIYV